MRNSIASSIISLFPPGRRFLEAFRNLQATVRQLQEERTGLPAVSTTEAIGSAEVEDCLNRAAAREIQLAAATHLPLLAGDLVVTEDGIEVVGSAIACGGLTQELAFFINGRAFDEVTYPIADTQQQERFAQIDGAAGFRARAVRDLATLKEAQFFRIDASPTGAYVSYHWRQAMWFMNPASEQFPMPPPANIRRVIGDDSVARFGLGGALIFKNVGAFLQEMGRNWNEFRTILDWGCGAGRITRYLLSGTEAAVYGADIDEDNIGWCTRNLPGGSFVRVALEPPTSLPSSFFDLVIGVSVVTHLTESMQFAWLNELQRITRPGALLFLSIAGATQFAHVGISPELYRRVQQVGFLDLSRDPALDGHIENSNYYRSTWHSRRYVTQTWSRYFDVVAIVDAIAALQDFVVLRRRRD